MKFAKTVLAAAAVLIAGPALGQAVGTEGMQFVQAVREGDNNKALDLLAANPILVNAKDTSGDTALRVAVANRDDAWTSHLLNKGADPNIDGKDGEPPLVAAARIGNVDAVQTLLRHDAKVDSTNRLGETALIIAVRQRHAQVVRRLLEAGANPDKSDSAQGFSAREYAKRDGRSREILRLFEARPEKPGN